MDDTGKTSFWTRMVADQGFREAVIADPLGAVAAHPDVAVSGEQVRQLEDMDYDDRYELITQIVRDAFFKGAVSRFGPLREDGALGGPPPEEPDGESLDEQK